MRLKPRFGWFLFFRRIGVKLGLITKPLFPDYGQEVVESSYYYRTLALWTWLREIYPQPSCLVPLIYGIIEYRARTAATLDFEPGEEERLLLDPFILHPEPATAIWEWLTTLGWGHLIAEEAVLQGNLKINSWPRYESVEHYIKKED